MVRALIGRWWVAFAASSLFVVSGHLLIKAGLNAAAGAAVPELRASRDSFSQFCSGRSSAGLLIYFLGSICWMIAVAQREISFLYPLSSINYVLVVIDQLCDVLRSNLVAAGIRRGSDRARNGPDEPTGGECFGMNPKLMIWASVVLSAVAQIFLKKGLSNLQRMPAADRGILSLGLGVIRRGFCVAVGSVLRGRDDSLVAGFAKTGPFVRLSRLSPPDMS